MNPATTDRAPLSEPATQASVDALLERVDALAKSLEALTPLLALADQGPALLAMVGDSADDLARMAAEAGIDLEQGAIRGATAALRFGAFMDAEKVASLEALLKSGVFDPHALRVVGSLAEALAATAAAEPPRLGAVAIVNALRRPDVQRAAGFLVMFAERFGRGLLERPPAR